MVVGWGDRPDENLVMKAFAMRQRPLGQTGLMVSELCLGTMTWGKQNTEAEAHAQMDYA